MSIGTKSVLVITNLARAPHMLSIALLYVSLDSTFERPVNISL